MQIDVALFFGLWGVNLVCFPRVVWILRWFALVSLVACMAPALDPRGRFFYLTCPSLVLPFKDLTLLGILGRCCFAVTAQRCQLVSRVGSPGRGRHGLNTHVPSLASSYQLPPWYRDLTVTVLAHWQRRRKLTRFALLPWPRIVRSF